ncbi:MAG: ArnT family glycosyltransferase [Bacteroidia bacterium]
MELANRRGFKAYLIILFVLSLLLFFINIKDSHDWGDDFAQYIHRAKNLVEGIPQQQTGYVFNEHYPIYSPPAFTMGFPLLLSPVYYFYGNNLVAFNYFMSFILALIIIFTYVFLCRYMKPVYAFFISTALLFNPLLINFKTEILSDLPFTLFLLLCILVYYHEKHNWIKVVFLGLLAGFLISIRSVGFSFLAALFINEAFLFFKFSRGTNRNMRWVKNGIIVPAIAGFVYYALNYWLFNLSGGNIHSPSRIFTLSHLSDIFFRNLNYQMNAWQSLLFTPDENKYAFISSLAKSVLLSGVVFGFVMRCKKNFSFLEIFIISYMLVLLVYPYSNPGFRFLFPLIPLFMPYLYEWFKVINKSLGTSKNLFIVLSVLALYFLYKHDLKKIIDNEQFITHGPQRLTSADIFSFVRQNTKENERFLFSKPMVLSLYAGRECMAVNPDEEWAAIAEQIREYKIKYILTCTELINPATNKYIENNSERLQLIKSNDLFKLYSIPGQ